MISQPPAARYSSGVVLAASAAAQSHDSWYVMDFMEYLVWSVMHPSLGAKNKRTSRRNPFLGFQRPVLEQSFEPVQER